MFGHCFDTIDRQIRVDLLELSAYCGDHLLRVARSSNKKCEITSVLWTQIAVHKRSLVFPQTEVFAVTNYPYDIDPRSTYAIEAEPFSDRRFAWPKATRETFVYYSRARARVA